MNVLTVLFSAATFAATLRMAVPLLFVALGGVLTKRAGIENIGLEGLMLIGCFSGFAANYFTSSWIVGILAAMAVTVLFALLFGLFVVQVRSHEIVAGTAMNVMGSALTTYLLRSMFGVKGSFADERVRTIPNVTLPVIKDIPVLGTVFSGQSVLFWVSLAATVLIIFMLYRTKLGFYIRAAGENEKALASAGVNVKKVRYFALIMHGMLIGLGGIYLSTAYLTQYVEDMTAGRGFIAMAAYAFGMARPGRTFFAVLLFAFVQALSSRLQIFGVPSYFADMIPYAITILVLAVTSYREMKRESV